MGVMAKWRNSKDQKIIYDSHEYQIEQSGKPKWMKPFMKVLEGFCIKRVNHVITVSDSIANEYVRIYKINKPWLVLNCPNYVETPQRDIFRQKYNLSQDTMVFLYQGGFSPNRGIEQILEAFQSLKDPKKIIVFMGYGVLAEDIQKAASKSNNIFYHDAVEHDVLLEYTASADIVILTYQNTCLNHYYCSPNKFFEYTMAGLPIIVSNLYELSRLVKNYGNGFIIKENTAESLQDTVLNLTPDDIKSSKENIGAMKQEFCWEQQENTLLKIYKSII